MINMISMILLLIIMLFPISINGLVDNNIFEYIALLFSFLIYLFLFFTNRLIKINLYICIILCVYLIISFLNLDKNLYVFSIPRMINILSPLLLFSIDFHKKIRFDKLEKLFEYIFYFILIGNLLSLFNIFDIQKYLIEYYTQYQSYITSYQFTSGKPIWIFGVHNIAAFIYTGLFIISYIFYKKTSRKKYLYYAMIYFFLNIFLKCSTSFGYMIYSVIFILFMSKLSKKKIIFIMLLFLFFVIFINSDIFIAYQNSLTSETNGFISRYFSDGFFKLFSDNLEVLKENILGISFTIASQEIGVYYADSGYLLTLTIGNIFFFIMFYTSLSLFCLKNIRQHKLTILIILYLLIMELGFITFYYYRTLIFFLFLILSIKSISNNTIQQLEYNNSI